ncbi:MAG: hypothetical protein Q4P66_08780 [Actinomycetaceae bacterium]|nr:hypothetical protein [Actinomycetaceae bacterium]
MEEYVSKPRRSGAHAILVNNNYIDIMIRDRGSLTTAVVFHAALPAKIKTYPFFSGERFTKDTNINLVAVSDPSLSLGDINLAWFLGNRRQGKLRPILSPIIQHALSSLETKQTILFGVSGGGYAAANFAWDFPDSFALLLNPRLDMRRNPPAAISKYLSVCHDAHSATPMRRIRNEFVVERISDLALQGLNHDLLIYQNISDTT